MKLSYTEIFKHSDILNPVSSTTLLSAGKLAHLGHKSVVLDLGSGKGFPSLLWASTFGVQVEGFDLNKHFVEYANSRAKMLNLSSQVKYSCKDVKGLKFDRKCEAVAYLGLGLMHVYGDRLNALRIFRTMLRRGGVLFLAEPIWLKKPVPYEVLKSLGETKGSFLTETEMWKLIEESGFHVLGTFASSKEDWELYVGPVYTTIREVVKSNSELAHEARKVMKGFEAEYAAAGQHWNMLLLVAKNH